MGSARPVDSRHLFLYTMSLPPFGLRHIKNPEPDFSQIGSSYSDHIFYEVPLRFHIISLNLVAFQINKNFNVYVFLFFFTAES